MIKDLTRLSRLTQRFVRSGDSLRVQTLDDASVVHEFEFTGVPQGAVPEEVPIVAQAILAMLVLGNLPSGGDEFRSNLRDAMQTAPAVPVSEVPRETAVVVGDLFCLGNALVVVTTAGTTGAAVPAAPIAGVTPGTTPAGITDGTAVLWSIGSQRVMANPSIIEVALSDASGTSTLTLTNPQTAPGSFENFSAPFLNPITTGQPNSRAQAYAWNTGSAVVDLGGAGRIGNWSSRAFSTDSDLVHIGYFGTSSTFLSEFFRVRVDGVLVSGNLLRPGGQGSGRHLALSIPGGIEDRVIVIESAGGLALSYVGVPTGRYIRAPRTPGNVLGWFSDSFGHTESPSCTSQSLDLAPRVGARLGFRHTLAAAVGGVSYAFNDGTNSNKSLAAQLNLNQLDQHKLDTMIFGLSYNATALATADAAAQEATAAGVCWSTFRAQFPGKMLVIGPWYRRTGLETRYANVRAALREKFLEFGDFKSYFIDPFDDSIIRGDGLVLRGAGFAWLPTGSWAIGADAVHPSPAGVGWLEHKIAEAAELCLSSV